MLKRLKRLFCSHEFYLSAMTSRGRYGRVSNCCIKCKKVLTAGCELSLNGKFIADLTKAGEK